MLCQKQKYFGVGRDFAEAIRCPGDVATVLAALDRHPGEPRQKVAGWLNAAYQRSAGWNAART